MKHINIARFIPIIEQGVISGSNFLMSIIIVRLLSFEAFSEFAMAQIVALAFVAINQSLIVSPFQTLAPKSEKIDVQGVFRLQFAMVTVLAVGLLLIGAFFVFYGVVGVGILVFGSIFCLGLVFQDFYRKLNYTTGTQGRLLWVSIFVVLFQLLAVLSLYLMEWLNLEVLLLVLAIPNIVILISCLFKFGVGIPSLRMIKTYWGFGKWLFYNAVIQWFSGNLVITIGVFFLGSAVAGVVRLAQNIVGVLSLVFQVLENVIPPKIAFMLKSDGIAHVKGYLSKLTLRIGLALGVGVVLMILFSDRLYGVLYGQDAVENAFMLKWFGPLLLCSLLNIPFRHFFRTIDQTNVLFQSYVFGVAISVIAVLLFVQVIGIHAIGLSLIVGQLSMFIWFLVRYISQENELRNRTYSPR